MFRILALMFVCFTTEFNLVEGRKCICTSKVCLDSGRHTCRTRFSCYTELIPVGEGQTISTTRGCTETAQPLLCESLPGSARSALRTDDASSGQNLAQLRWPLLLCCDSHDYCNDAATDLEDHSRTSLRLGQEPVTSSVVPKQPPDPPDRDRDSDRPGYPPPSGTDNGLNSLTPRQVKPLHVAAIVLAVAAFISVVAAAYVITRFLRLNPYPSVGYD